MASLEMNRRVQHAAAPILRLRPATRAWLAFGFLLLLTAGFLWYETRGTTLWFDEWNWALYRRGDSLDTFLKSYNQHFSLVPLALYRLLFATAGLGDYGPYRAIVIAAHLGCSLLLFTYALRRVGSYLAFLVGTLFLLFGPAWQTSIWPLQVAWIIPVGAGIAALMLLDRGDRLGDVAAFVLTCVALASSGIGLPVALGLLVDVIGRPDRRRRWWIVILPLALYAVWWLGYQTSSFHRHNIVLTPPFVPKAAAGSLSSMLGLAGDPIFQGGPAPLTWGVPLLIAAIAVAGLRIWRLGGPSPRLVSLLVMALSFWSLIGLSRASLSLGYESRYLYVSAAFILLIAVELMRGVLLSTVAKAILGVVAIGVVISNLGALRDGARFLRDQAQQTKAALAVLDLTRGVVSPNYVTHGLPGYPLVTARAGAYFEAKDAYGTPAASPATLASDPEYIREAADADLTRIHNFRLIAIATAAGAGAAAPASDAVSGGSTTPRGSCTLFRPASFGPPSTVASMDFTLPPSGLVVKAIGGGATVKVRRFADQYPADPQASLSQSASALVRIGRDGSAVPWHVRISPSASAAVCAAG